MGDIEARGAQLAQVTTANLDALRAYSLSGKRRATRAVIIEAPRPVPSRSRLIQFVLAQLGIAPRACRHDDLALAKQQALAARQNSARLSQPPRSSSSTPSSPASTQHRSYMPRFKLWASLYPICSRPIGILPVPANNHYPRCALPLRARPVAQESIAWQRLLPSRGCCFAQSLRRGAVAFQRVDGRRATSWSTPNLRRRTKYSAADES
jgi:hypothetical protein